MHVIVAIKLLYLLDPSVLVGLGGFPFRKDTLSYQREHTGGLQSL